MMKIYHLITITSKLHNHFPAGTFELICKRVHYTHYGPSIITCLICFDFWNRRWRTFGFFVTSTMRTHRVLLLCIPHHHHHDFRRRIILFLQVFLNTLLHPKNRSMEIMDIEMIVNSKSSPFQYFFKRIEFCCKIGKRY